MLAARSTDSDNLSARAVVRALSVTLVACAAPACVSPPAPVPGIRPLSAIPGALELVRQLERHLPVAVATNAPRELIELALARVGLGVDLPIVSADGMPGKPAPDVYLAACQRLGVEPHRAVAFEDSPVGAAAAKAAGLTLIYVRSGEPAAVTPDLIVGRLDDPAVRDLFAPEHVSVPDPTCRAATGWTTTRPRLCATITLPHRTDASAAPGSMRQSSEQRR